MSGTLNLAPIEDFWNAVILINKLEMDFPHFALICHFLRSYCLEIENDDKSVHAMACLMTIPTTHVFCRGLIKHLHSKTLFPSLTKNHFVNCTITNGTFSMLRYVFRNRLNEEMLFKTVSTWLFCTVNCGLVLREAVCANGGILKEVQGARQLGKNTKNKRYRTAIEPGMNERDLFFGFQRLIIRLKRWAYTKIHDFAALDYRVQSFKNIPLVESIRHEFDSAVYRISQIDTRFRHFSDFYRKDRFDSWRQFKYKDLDGILNDRLFIFTLNESDGSKEYLYIFPETARQDVQT